ncbi:hypothetical protein C5B94_09000 [Clavibacter michiganensis]|nr:hypothetical protein C5B94_09000 [Clavibacter michiganensis]
MFAVKAPLDQSLVESVGLYDSDIATDLLDGEQDRITATYWPWETPVPEQLTSEPATIVTYLDRDDQRIAFTVLLSSGMRDPAGDSLATARAYEGDMPPSYYTCYQVELGLQAGRMTEYGRITRGDDQVRCPMELVKALPAGAVFMPPAAFDG